MKTHRSNPLAAPFWAGLIPLVVALATLGSAPRALAQANASPPERMTYQGFLTDASGAPLGNAAPKNYDVVFRLWKNESSTAVADRLWTEQQTVTVDKGYFSVLLGEGGNIGEAKPALSSVFTGADASERWLDITVKGIGAGGADAPILPRLRMLPAPYSYLAQKAISANTATSVDGGALTSGTIADARLSSNVALRSGANTFSGNQTVNGTVTATSVTAGAVTVNGTVTATSVAGNGASLINLNAGQVTTGTLPSARLAGSYPSPLTLTNSANRFEGNGTIPIGGIIMWSGATAPAGWALCTGATVNGVVTPDLRGRFVLASGAGAGLTSRTVSGKGGAETHALTLDQMPSHSHTVSVNTLGYTSGYNSSSEAATSPNNGKNNQTGVWGTSAVGGGAAFDKMPPFYVLAFIMRVQ